MSQLKLVPPCSYQGGKQKLSKKIVDIIFEQNEINEDTKFYDLCCGSGAITLELINRGIHPSNISMVDNSDYGMFWNSIANDEFDINKFEEIINAVPDNPYRKQYLLDLSKTFDKENQVYHYLLLQSGSFGGKALWSEHNKWKHHGFRNYWTPTETSIRRSHCNSMQPEPNVMLGRVNNIVNICGGNIRGINDDVLKFTNTEVFEDNSIVYIDPPYVGTTGYKSDLNVMDVVNSIPKNIPIYVSEYNILSDSYEFIIKGNSKGNITRVVKSKRKDDLLNIFNK
ncbi:DNA adenine methylase [Terrisporobacter sp.]|uniref:DNA adenine methylase n=1 Tax=Terrisporobacter sp. TaxID=1965305 RepID=UPI00289CA5CA|nr:DNA adenine methylase [Terrisporobacter sp.]